MSEATNTKPMVKGTANGLPAALISRESKDGCIVSRWIVTDGDASDEYEVTSKKGNQVCSVCPVSRPVIHQAPARTHLEALDDAMRAPVLPPPETEPSKPKAKASK